MPRGLIDWHAWHGRYADQASPLRRRLAVVQAQLSKALPAELDSPLQIISLCAGQGLDVIEVLAAYPHAPRVTARLVELDERNVVVARQRANAAGLSQVEVLVADAARLAAYEGAAPPTSSWSAASSAILPIRMSSTPSTCCRSCVELRPL